MGFNIFFVTAVNFVLYEFNYVTQVEFPLTIPACYKVLFRLSWKDKKVNKVRHFLLARTLETAWLYITLTLMVMDSHLKWTILKVQILSMVQPEH